MKALGTPDVANGAKISSTISKGIADAATAFADAKDDAAKASTDPKKFRSTISRISDHVDRDLRAVGDDLDVIDTLDKDGELDTAFKSESACAFLEDSSS